MSLYCKKCGRQLRPEARFCDRCGFVIKKETVKRSAAPQRSADRRRETAKRKKSGGGKVFLVLLFAILLGVVSAMVAYNMMSQETQKAQVEDTVDEKESDIPTQKPKQVEDEEKDEPEETKKPQKEQETKVKKEADFSMKDSCLLYDNNKMKGIKCPYPEDFVQSSRKSSDTLISYEDSLNDGYMKICSEEIGSSDSASKLMREYTDGLGVKPQHTDSGDGWYEVSFVRNNKYNHRKAVLVDGTCIYYDFSYDSDSEEKATYDDYIEYIDFYLGEELADTTSSKK